MDLNHARLPFRHTRSCANEDSTTGRDRRELPAGHKPREPARRACVPHRAPRTSARPAPCHACTPRHAMCWHTRQPRLAGKLPHGRHGSRDVHHVGGVRLDESEAGVQGSVSEGTLETSSVIEGAVRGIARRHRFDARGSDPGLRVRRDDKHCTADDAGELRWLPSAVPYVRIRGARELLDDHEQVPHVPLRPPCSRKRRALASGLDDPRHVLHLPRRHRRQRRVRRHRGTRACRRSHAQDRNHERRSGWRSPDRRKRCSDLPRTRRYSHLHRLPFGARLRNRHCVPRR